MSMRAVRRSLFVVLAAVLVTVACPDDPPAPPVVTTITVSPTTRAFTALSQTQQFTATVLDQRGNAMTTAVVWGASNGTVATVGTGGLVTAQAVGSATISATIGTVSGSAAVTVTQVPSQLLKDDGDAQSAPVGTQLPVPVVARVIDAQGRPIPGVTVGFAVTAGGGSVGTPSSTTNGLGRASTTWTLGSNTGPQSLTPSSTGLTSPLPFSATALAAPPDTVIKNTADGLAVPAGTEALPRPAVLVRDQFGNPAAGIGVTFAVTQGGGQVTGASQFTNSSGIATVGSWVVGASGAQEMTATVTGSGIGGNPVTFAFTATPPGAPNSIIVVGGNDQTGLAGYPLNVRPAARVRDAANNPVSGATVTFAVTGGGGSVTGATATTDIQGNALVGSWSINLGANTMTASVAGVATPATFTATGDSSRYTIVVRYALGSNPTISQRAAFDSAAARWSRVIFGDLQDVNISVTASSCQNAGLPASNETVDDVLIFAIVGPIDGPGGILGRAGPCAIRPSPTLLTAFGLMQFDDADLVNLENAGILEDVILHEMAHVLGAGTLWEIKGFLVGKDQPGTAFTGSQAIAAFDAIGGTGFTGAKVPVEDCVAGVPVSCGGGTRNGHWREFIFRNELMTGYVDGPNPLSIATAAQFGDLGYVINLGDSDAFSVTLPLLRALRAAATGVHLGNDILRMPIDVIDANGRVLRTIQPQ